MTETKTSSAAETNISEEEASTGSFLGWLGQYLFWVFVLFSVVAFTWFSAAGSSAFRYAGF